MTELSWNYVAEAADGTPKRGIVSAPDKISATRQVRSKKLIPVSIEQSSKVSSKLTFRLHQKQPKLKLSSIVSFCHSLSDLLRGGIPLGKSLELLSRQYNEKSLRLITQQLSNSVRSGQPLSAALKQCQPQFPKLIVAMVAAGENTGKLSEQFSTLTEHYESQLKFKKELVGQLIYPTALLALIILTIMFLSYFVLPQFESIFENADTSPPVETQIVITGGKWLRSYGFFLPLVVLISLTLGRLIVSRYQLFFEKTMLSTPLLGNYWRNLYAGRFSRSLGSLLVGGASMTSSLNIALQTVTSQVLGPAYEKVSDRIRSGTTFSKAILESNLFPEKMMGLISLGDEIGNLGPMLLRSADRCEQDIKADLTKITNIIGPIMTALMGLLTAGVIASVMSGVLSLNDTIY